MVTVARLHGSPIRPLKRSEYDKLVDQDAFVDERIELLRGFLVEMSPQKTPHTYAVTKLNKLLLPAIGGRGEVRIQMPFAATDDSEPEPDVAIVPPGDYLDGHPTKAFLIVEVAESSLRIDRVEKAPLYAEARVPEYWIVNLRDRVFEVHTQPRAGRYARVRKAGVTEKLAVPGFPRLSVAVRDVLPPR